MLLNVNQSTQCYKSIWAHKHKLHTLDPSWFTNNQDITHTQTFRVCLRSHVVRVCACGHYQLHRWWKLCILWWWDRGEEGGGGGGGGGEHVASLSLPRPSCSSRFSVSLVWWVKEAEMEEGGERKVRLYMMWICLNLIDLKWVLEKTDLKGWDTEVCLGKGVWGNPLSKLLFLPKAIDSWLQE